MRPNGIREAWAAGRPALGAWLMIPSAFCAEIVAHAKFDWVCVDMQHGIIDYAQMVTMLQAVSSTEVTPLVRVPWNEPGIIGKSLDAGARGVIIPMVNSRADAERAVQACRYAPLGARSYGPVRANYSVGFDYFTNANADVLCETLITGGLDVLTGGTDTHLLQLDLRGTAWTGKDAEERLDEVKLTVNRNTVPFDERKPTIASGVRIGTPAATMRGFDEEDFREIGRIIVEALGDAPDLGALRSRAEALCARRPLYPGFRGFTTYLT